MKPALFNTETTQAILEDRKSTTRRCVKYKGWDRKLHPVPANAKYTGVHCGRHVWETANSVYSIKAPYHPCDILYVRETWYKDAGRYMYRANYTEDEKFYRNGKEISIKWCPSIHMPKEAARLFLRVKGVKVERLKDITDEQAKEEGVRGFWIGMGESGYAVSADSKTFYDGPVGAFANLWNTTIKPADLRLYGWKANPWVWVIEFERISKEAALEKEAGTK